MAQLALDYCIGCGKPLTEKTQWYVESCDNYERFYCCSEECKVIAQQLDAVECE